MSKDSPVTNAKWADKEELPFGLLTDEAGELRTLVGHPEDVIRPINRITLVIDKMGIVCHIVWFKGRGDVMEHITQSLEALKEL